jgi:hypothetical protein
MIVPNAEERRRTRYTVGDTINTWRKWAVPTGAMYKIVGDF